MYFYLSCKDYDQYVCWNYFEITIKEEVAVADGHNMKLASVTKRIYWKFSSGKRSFIRKCQSSPKCLIWNISVFWTGIYSIDGSNETVNYVKYRQSLEIPFVLKNQALVFLKWNTAQNLQFVGGPHELKANE